MSLTIPSPGEDVESTWKLYCIWKKEPGGEVWQVIEYSTCAGSTDEMFDLAEQYKLIMEATQEFSLTLIAYDFQEPNQCFNMEDEVIKCVAISWPDR